MSHALMESRKLKCDLSPNYQFEGPSRSLKQEVLRLYQDVPIFTRLFLKLRWQFTPYGQIAACAPPEGLILDLGCGHGLLSLTLALQSPKRIIHAVDHDVERIRIARRAAGNLTNIQFQEANFSNSLNQKAGHAAAVVLMDAMHYLTLEEQEQLIEKIRAILVPGGLVIMREVDITAGLTSRINKVHEWAMTACGFTKAERIFYRTPEQWEALFRKTGFSVQSRPCGCFPFSDRLFIGQKE